MKIFKFLVIALVAVLGFTGCEHECDWLDVDYSKELAGTWTCFTEDYAEALVIKADGSVTSYGVKNGKSWKDVKGAVEAARNKLVMIFDDLYNFEGRFEIIPGEAFSIFNENGDRLVYRYCANNLSNDVVGMWVCNDATSADDEEMLIQTFDANGTVTMTGVLPGSGDFVLDSKMPYQVVGDLCFYTIDESDAAVCQLVYAPNGTALGDILTMRDKYKEGGKSVEENASFLRIKQSLNFSDKKYAYSSTYVSNVKAKDEDINMMGYTFNFSKMDGSNLDKIFKYLFFAVEFSGNNTIKYQYTINGQKIVFEAPVTVQGNKVTVHMSQADAVYRDVVLYMFQDAKDSQLHMYMPTTSFINYFANTGIAGQIATGKIDKNDETAIATVFDRMAERVQSINVSFVLKAAK